jgi:hypothetical protein
MPGWQPAVTDAVTRSRGKVAARALTETNEKIGVEPLRPPEPPPIEPEEARLICWLAIEQEDAAGQPRSGRPAAQPNSARRPEPHVSNTGSIRRILPACSPSRRTIAAWTAHPEGPAKRANMS